MNKSRAGYGGEVLAKLSEDEGISESVLDRCKQFSEKFPGIFPPPISAGRQKSSATLHPAFSAGGWMRPSAQKNEVKESVPGTFSPGFF